jgi:hypothetical protein
MQFPPYCEIHDVFTDLLTTGLGMTIARYYGHVGKGRLFSIEIVKRVHQRHFELAIFDRIRRCWSQRQLKCAGQRLGDPSCCAVAQRSVCESPSLEVSRDHEAHSVTPYQQRRSTSCWAGWIHAGACSVPSDLAADMAARRGHGIKRVLLFCYASLSERYLTLARTFTLQ